MKEETKSLIKSIENLTERLLKEEPPRVLTVDELHEIVDREDCLTPVWVEEHDGMTWVAALDMAYNKVIAVIGVDLYQKEETYGIDWIAWSKPPIPGASSKINWRQYHKAANEENSKALADLLERSKANNGILQ